MEIEMDESLLQLSFAIYNNPGVYALLLGSGVSFAAEIPTGWAIMNDLISQIAHVRGVEELENPHEWYHEQCNETPTYSGLLEKLAATPTERNKILRGYFEPTDQERERGAKEPTRAHRAIAELIKDGYIKVVLTTNFDRLLETALEAIGVTPDVLSADAMIEGAVPLQHSPITIIKLHGDYRDPNSLNTSEELSNYTDAKSELLMRVLDEYGLIVCGWSAEWDGALQDAIYGAKNRRYAMYWAAFGEPTPKAQELIQHRGAQRIDIEGADEFFDSIGRNVEAIKSAKRSNPLSIEVLIERTKKLIPNENSFIELEELILKTSDAAYHEFTSEAFMSRRAEILLPAANNNFTEEILDGLADLYFAVCEPTLQVLATLTRYGNDEQSSYIEKVLNNWLVSSTNGEYEGIWRFLPTMFVIYTCGVVATNERKTSYLSALLTKPNLSWQRKLFAEHLSFLEKLKEAFLFPLVDHIYNQWCKLKSS
jgi:hypothetical protein